MPSVSPSRIASRSRAEVAVARTQQIQAEQAVEIAAAALGQLLGVPAAEISIDPAAFLRAPPVDLHDSTVSQHPLALAGEAAVAEVKAREKALDRTYYPRLSLEVLSMGMSGDFAIAIEEGATRIRIGTSLFGPRKKPALRYMADFTFTQVDTGALVVMDVKGMLTEV